MPLLLATPFFGPRAPGCATRGAAPARRSRPRCGGSGCPGRSMDAAAARRAGRQPYPRRVPRHAASGAGGPAV